MPGGNIRSPGMATLASGIGANPELVNLNAGVRIMHKRIVIIVSAVLFALVAAAMVIVADLQDRDFPVQLGAKSQVSLDFSQSGMSDEEAFRQLGMLSDKLGIGLVKIAPDLSGNQSGQVFAVVGAKGNFPDTIRRFGDQPDAQIKGSAALAHSYAGGQYFVTGEMTKVPEFKSWLVTHHVGAEWANDSLADTLQYLAKVESFAKSLLAAATLMVSLVLYWLSVKARGRALRLLAGVPIWRIQFEDLVEFLTAMAAAAVVCDLVAVTYVGLARDWIFVPSYAWALLVFNAMVILTTMLCAVAISLASRPSAKMLAAREPAVKSLQATAVVLKTATFVLVLATVAPALVTYTDARGAATQQAHWNSLADQVALSFPAGTGESGFQEIMPSVGAIVSEAEASDTAALSYTWTNEFTHGAFEPYDYVSLVNQRWLNLMLDNGPNDGSPGNQLRSELTPLPLDRIPSNAKEFLILQLPLWSRDHLSAAQILRKVSFYQSSSSAEIPMSLGGGGSDLLFSNTAIVVVAPSLYGLFNDDFLTSAASTGNIMFTGLGSTETMIARHGLQNKIYVKYVAEEGVLRAQLAAYFAWLQGISLVALVVALVVAALIGAFITAVLKARRDFPLRLAGKRWTEILADRVAREWVVGIALTALVILFRGLGGGALVAMVAAAGLLLSPLTHVAAARWAFMKVSLRSL